MEEKPEQKYPPSCANTRGHSDRKMVWPALTTDGCGSWIQAWREEFSHLQLSPISSLSCASWPLKMMAALGQNTENWCVSFFPCFQDWLYSFCHWQHWLCCKLRSRTGSQFTPQQYFPANCHYQESKDNMPIAIPHCPVLSDVSHTNVWTQTPAHFISMTSKPRTYFWWSSSLEYVAHCCVQPPQLWQ